MSETPHPSTPAAPRRARRFRTVLGAAALLLAGAGAGAGALSLTHHRGHAAFDTGLATTPITQLKDSDQVEVQGTVAEIFGNKFVVSDSGGRALVETGRAGEDGNLVKAGESVTVQGRFEHGFLHASALQRADGKIRELRPVPPPPPHDRPAPPRPDAG